LLLLADIKAPVDIPPIKPSILLITERFYDLEHGIFRLPDMCRFPIPCLNGNMIYLHHYFETSHSETLDKTIGFSPHANALTMGISRPRNHIHTVQTFSATESIPVIGE